MKLTKDFPGAFCSLQDGTIFFIKGGVTSQFGIKLPAQYNGNIIYGYFTDIEKLAELIKALTCRLNYLVDQANHEITSIPSATKLKKPLTPAPITG